MNPYFIQFIGFLGLLGIVISFQKDKRSSTLIARLFATLFFTLHFSLLHAWSGAAMNALVGSWAGLATETFILASLSLAIFRFEVKNKKGHKQGI